jgi:hypothetical protein
MQVLLAKFKKFPGGISPDLHSRRRNQRRRSRSRSVGYILEIGERSESKILLYPTLLKMCGVQSKSMGYKRTTVIIIIVKS